MDTIEILRDRIQARFPAAIVSLVLNPGLSGQHSLLIDAVHAVRIATWLRDEPGLQLDTCSNVTGIDYLDKETTDTVKETVAATETTPEKVVEKKVKRLVPGYLEVVYHLYSMRLKHGPVILRQRTPQRTGKPSVASLTPVWRACEFQEREVFDLFGIRFDGHPDLRRILMWDGFVDSPMRKDYVEPDDYEWEPTPHDAVLERARLHYPATPATKETP